MRNNTNETALPTWLIVAIMLSPLIVMWLLPFSDTTEPRYAEIARYMAQTNDWITPWFKPGVPFWGKPPLSFWAQALSIKFFGASEFAARLPAWLVTLVTLKVIYEYARTVFNVRVAQYAIVIYMTTVLGFMAAGAVMTDAFLTLGTVLCMTGWVMIGRSKTLFWRYAFFLGLAIGMLAKGPLTVVLTGGSLVLWMLFYPEARQTWRKLPWVSGVILAAAISLPWYIAAELKTPGFLNYFIIGEHFYRFIDPGWQGDHYGYAHKEPIGSIWFFGLQSTFPWSLMALYLLGRLVGKRPARQTARAALRNPDVGYVVAWMLFLPLFFTVAGNILWTYVLPCLGAFCIILALAIDSLDFKRTVLRVYSLVTPVVILILLTVVMFNPNMIKTEKGLIQYAKQHGYPDIPLIYVELPPFSARFYSAEGVQTVEPDHLKEKLAQVDEAWIAITNDWAEKLRPELGPQAQEKYKNMRYVLFHYKRSPATQ